MIKQKKEFYSYVIPSVLSFALTGLYCFADAFFVGNAVGENSLAAINIAFSFLSIIIAFGSGIGMGASVKIQVAKSRGEEYLCYASCANILMLATGSVIAIPMLIFPREIMILLGASENIALLGTDYMRICAIGSVIQVFGCGLIPICRNMDKSGIAAVSAITGNVLNIVLDWLFVNVFKWGMRGAAAATVIGQISCCVICLITLTKIKSFIFRTDFQHFRKCSKEIIMAGISPFGLIIVPNITVIVLNKASLHYGQDTGLAAYGCIAYLVYVVYLVLQGVSDGSQPLISKYYALNDSQNEHLTKKMTFEVSLVIALISFVACVICRKFLSTLMGACGNTALLIEEGLPICALGFFFVAVSRTCASNLYACEKNTASYIISYTEPLFILIAVLVMPSKLGLQSVWLSNTIGQFAVMLTGLFLVIKSKH